MSNELRIGDVIGHRRILALPEDPDRVVWSGGGEKCYVVSRSEWLEWAHQWRNRGAYPRVGSRWESPRISHARIVRAAKDGTVTYVVDDIKNLCYRRTSLAAWRRWVQRSGAKET